MNWLERTSFFMPRMAIRMIFRGLYRSVTSLTGHPAVQVPQEKHRVMCSPPGSRAMRSLKSGSRSLESIIASTHKGSRGLGFQGSRGSPRILEPVFLPRLFYSYPGDPAFVDESTREGCRYDPLDKSRVSFHFHPDRLTTGS